MLILQIGCAQSAFQTLLYNLDYTSDNEAGLFVVFNGNNSAVATIPQDEFKRPDKDFFMDMYEYPNHPENGAQNDAGYLPLVNVNWYEARDICISHGKRLCSIYEWRETCFSNGNGQRKLDGNFYPYTGAYDKDVCVTETSSAAKNGSRTGCRSEVSGKQVSVNGSVVGNSNGVYDMSGNVWEWVDHDFYGQKSEFEGQQAIVGGYYFTGGNARCDLNLIVSSNNANAKTGFRCCRDKDVAP